MVQAVLLAAGKANRILPLTAHRPKGMLLLGGKPLLQHALEAVKAHGIDDFTIVTGSDGERIQAFFKDGADFGVEIRYAHQAEPTGTLDALRCTLPELDMDAPAWVVPGSLLLNADTLRPLAKAKGTRLLVGQAQAGHVQGVPEVKGDRLAAMTPGEPVPDSTRVSTGLFVASAAFLHEADNGFEGLHYTDEALGAWAEAGHEVRVAEPAGPWGTVIEPWDLLRLNERVLDSLPHGKPRMKAAEVKGPIQVGKNTSISPTASILGPVTIGDGCTIGDRTVIGPYVSIRNNTVIGSHCEVRRSILNNNVLLDSRAVLRGSILDDGVQVGPGFLCAEDSTRQGPVGCILGADSEVGAGVRVEAGAVLDPEATVKAGGTLKASCRK